MSRWMCSILLLSLVSVTAGCNGHRIERPYWLSFRPFSFGTRNVVEETVSEGTVISSEVISEDAVPEGAMPAEPIPAPQVVDEPPAHFSGDSVILDSGMDVTPLQSGTLSEPGDREPAPLNLLPE